MKQKRFLISRPDRIGDVVLSTGMPREIKKQFPGSFVAVLVRSYTKDIFLENPFVDKIIIDDFDPADRWKGFWNKLKEIKKFRFNHGLMLLPNERINYLMFLAGIKKRFGSSNKFYHFITCTKSISRKKYIPLRHEADYCMDLARASGVKAESFDPEIYLSVEEKKLAEKKRAELLGEKKYLIGIHSTSGSSAPNLAPKDYKLLIEQLKETEKYQIVVTDNKPPYELRNIDGVVYPNSNSSLRDSIINISALDILVSASTGPMHLAAALKIKTVSMFCQLNVCSPALWGPRGNSSKIILPPEDFCSNKCVGDPHICSFSTEGGIKADDIVEKIKQFIVEAE